MIDRKALRISGTIFLVMVAATIWRLSLFPDWKHLPVGNPAAHQSMTGLLFFAGPASLLIAMGTPFIAWLMSPEETLPSWRRWSGRWIVSWAVFVALMQAFILARSLGLVSLSAMGTARAGLVLIGIMFMLTGNAAPKTPLPSQRNSPLELDSWQGNRLLRFAGRLLVGLGLAFALGGVLLPLELWRPVFLCLMLGTFAAGIFYRLKLGREARDKALLDAR